MYVSDLTNSSLNSNGVASDIYSQEDVLRAGTKRSAKKTQLFVQVLLIICRMASVAYAPQF